MCPTFIGVWRAEASFEVLLEVSDLHHDLFRVFTLLGAENIKFVLSILLHENVVLV